MPEIRMKPVIVSCQRACKLEVASIKEEPKRREYNTMIIYDLFDVILVGMLANKTNFKGSPGGF